MKTQYWRIYNVYISQFGVTFSIVPRHLPTQLFYNSKRILIRKLISHDEFKRSISILPQKELVGSFIQLVDAKRHFIYPQYGPISIVYQMFFKWYFTTSLPISSLCFIERQIDVVCGIVLAVLPLCIALLPYQHNPKYFL